ncbi:hypothetical protein LJB81_00545 [Desulfovibrio sp. OttesenSCG-928-M14]|nr:hypothetical protein [Desulfovibrio sp. OttesenSCG-928-M14]
MGKQSIEGKYEKAFEQAASLHPIFPNAAREQMAQMVEVIAKGNENIYAELATGRDMYQKGGFIAEEFHAETFNLDAVLKGDNARAYTDRYDEWSQHQWEGKPLAKNDTPDIIVSRDGKVTTTGQSKYNYSPEETARQMSQTKDGAPKYEKVDHLIGPEDQVNPAGEVASIKDHAEAKAGALKNTGGDSAEIQAYEQTAAKSTDTLKDGKSSSTSLSKADADAMGSGDISKLKDIENRYQTKSTLKQMGNAAVGAAAMSAVVSGSMNTVRYIQLAREGRLTAEEATIKIVGETVAAAADSAVKASANAGVQSLMVRYGSEKAVVEVLAKQGLKSMMKSNAVTVGVVCAVDAVKDLVRLGMGDMTKEEFFERQGKGLMATSAGVVGGSLGVAGATALAGALGAGTGTLAMTAASVIGGLSGGMIAGLAMTMAIENGIEKPYRDLVRNTTYMHEAALELERVSKTVLMGQVLFTKYLEADADLEQQLEAQFDKIDAVGNEALALIMKI